MKNGRQDRIAETLTLFQLYPLIEFAKQLPEPIGYIFLIDD